MTQTEGCIVVDTVGPAADWMVLVHGVSQDHRLFDVHDFVLAADALEEIIPNTRRISIPGGGGFPLWEVPDLVNERVSSVLVDATSAH